MRAPMTLAFASSLSLFSPRASASLPMPTLVSLQDPLVDMVGGSGAGLAAHLTP